MFESMFNPDNPVFSFINKVVDVLFANILFVLCSLPIITIGPSMAGLYYAMVKVIRRGRGTLAKEFFRGFKENFKQGLIINIIIIALAAMMFVADFPYVLAFVDTKEVGDTLTLIFFLLKIVLLFGFTCWIYPMMTRFSQKLLKLAELSIVLMIRHFLTTVIGVFVLSLTMVTLIAEPLFLAVLPGVAALLISLPMEKVLRNLCNLDEIPDDGSVDTWYLE